MKLRFSVNKSSIILYAFFILILVRNFFPVFRHLIYLVTPLSALLLIINFKSKVRLNKNLKEFGLLFISITFLVLISMINLSDLFYERYVKESYFILSSFLAVTLTIIYFDSINYHKLLRHLFIISIVFTTLLYREKLLSLISFNFIDFFRSSASETETTLAYFFGIFAVYFFLRKKYRLFILSVLYAVLGSKRIVIGGIFIVVILYYGLYPLKNVLQRKKYLSSAFFATMNFFLATLFYLLTTGYFEDIIVQLTGFSGDYLLMGRLGIQDLVFTKVGFFPIFPLGIGYTSGLLESVGAHLVLIHSDILKLFLELGIIAAWLYFFLLYKLALRNYNSFILLLFYNFIMLTDNITIYFEFMFLFLLLLYITTYPMNRNEFDKINEK